MTVVLVLCSLMTSQKIGMIFEAPNADKMQNLLLMFLCNCHANILTKRLFCNLVSFIKYLSILLLL
jgi:hypothetical protein